MSKLKCIIEKIFINKLRLVVISDIVKIKNWAFKKLKEKLRNYDWIEKLKTY